jgi:hypothetical protein
MTAAGADWVEQARRLLADTGAGARLTDALGGLLGERPVADHSAECRWCPLCSALATLRARRPDLIEAVADVLATTATVLRASAAGSHPTPDGDEAGAGAPDPTPDPAEESVTQPAPAPVQRIDVA